MSQARSTLTLSLPDDIYQRVRRAAKGMKKPVEQALARIVAGATPSLEKVPAPYRAELEAMEDATDEVLWKETTRRAAPAQERRLKLLLQKNQHRELTDSEQEELDQLRSEADRLMLRRSYAYLLLKYRGHRIPGLADLHL